MVIAYFVHDLADPAVARRVTMLRRGGAEIRLFGFRRTSAPIAKVAGIDAHDLGRTLDARMLARAMSVVVARLTAGSWGREVAGADTIIARNLEMLVIAASVRRRFAPQAPLVYELLDVHRLLTGSHAASALLRSIELRLLRGCAGVIISSPAFEAFYLRKFHTSLPPVLLIENKVMPAESLGAGGAGMPPPLPLAPGPPWRIGWFGAIRCQRSLRCLSALVLKYPGLVEVDIRGRIGVLLADEFREVIARSPGMVFHGPYRYPDDLSSIYGQVHFSWAIDFSEAGLNSAWLLPNRLYEGCFCGAVPIAVRGVETGKWLATHGLGWVLDERIEESVETLLTGLRAEQYRDAAQTVRAADPEWFAATAAGCLKIVQTIEGLARSRPV